STDDLLEVVLRVLDRQRKMKAGHERIEEQLRVLGRFSSENPNPVLRISVDGTLLYANAASAGILSELEIEVGDSLPTLIRDLTTQARIQERTKDIELEISDRQYSLTVTPIRDADYVYLYGHDISNLKRAERELTRLKDQAQKLALYDRLTELPNRALLDERFIQELAYCKRHDTKLCVAFIDLDRFKQVNDTLGHKAGDELLVLVAKRLTESVRRTDTVARWGGDEFILLLPGIESLEGARTICEVIKERVQKKIASEDGVFVTMSMGAAICPDDGTAQEQLLQAADAALLMVKSRARNEVIVFGESPELKSFQEKNAIRALLCDAVSDGRIQVHYQPIVDAGTGSIIGAEALARWEEEGHGWISPGMFIPLAESMGLIEEMGRQVQQQALRFLRNCQAQGYFISLSINISIRQLLRSEFTSELLAKTEHYGLLPDQVTLELTESQALLGIHSESARLEELSAAGFHLSIDDFGKGHSSLASLHEMPVEELKIDMQFVRHLHIDKGRRIVQTIEELSRILGMETVAEGVETIEQQRILQELGICRLQGYLFAKPMPEDEFLTFLGHSKVSTTSCKRTSDCKALTLPS
ncbi:MAG: diguanylate cyclase (GGDEF)-like protein, partial [Verrucomicrobiales bacterium]